MRFQGYIIPLLLASLLSSTASYSQERDSAKVSVEDLEILGEGCIRQTGLENDTASMGLQLRTYSLLKQNYEKQICNLEEQNQNSEIAAISLSQGLKECNKDLIHQMRKAKVLKIGVFTLPIGGLIFGIWVGSKLGK